MIPYHYAPQSTELRLAELERIVKQLQAQLEELKKQIPDVSE